ncbi:MAG: aliphatic sulfonate transporter periplasmic ligand-binding protein [Chthonomonadaceae bacterium]|nr:aliphatic sulfonate transporter periplasmic ligand-binding protein [Chthonomonadaceae bacterium]
MKSLLAKLRSSARHGSLPWIGLNAVVLLGILLAGCHKAGSGGNSSAANADQRVFRFGHQHSGDTFLRARGILEKRLAERGYRVAYVEFAAGPQLLEALSVGSIDIGSTGESPPIFAQAAGSPLVYLANYPSTSTNGEGLALLVPKGSPIHSIQDLRGKRIAFQKASSAHNFLLQIVERAGLTYKDIHPVYLAPPDARAAFDSGSVDAWAIWDPFLTIAQRKTGGTILVNSQGIRSAGGFYLTSRSFVKEHSDILKITLQELLDSGIWAYDHPDEASQLRSKATGIDAVTWRVILDHTERASIRPITPEILQDQQFTADNYYKIGLLPKPVDVWEWVLSAEQYAEIVPRETGKQAAVQPADAKH